MPELDEAADALYRSHGGHTEGKEALLGRVAWAAHPSAVGKPTGLTPAPLVEPPGTAQDHPGHGVRQGAWDGGDRGLSAGGVGGPGLPPRIRSPALPDCGPATREDPVGRGRH